MPIILDQNLYNRVKLVADNIYDKPSAYKSMYIVKTYKEHGGKYGEDGKPRSLDIWKKENWTDVGGEDYPVYRPTVRINKDTPLTVNEIDPKNLKEQILLKQEIKGKSNLPEFKIKGGNLYDITDYTKKQAKKLGLIIFPSDNPKYKLEIYGSNGLFLFYGGDPDYSDYSTYIKTHGIDYANERRRLYQIRHKKEIDNIGSRGYVISKLLW